METLPTPQPSSHSNSSEQLLPRHTLKRRQPCAWRSNGSCHRSKPRPCVLTANHFLKRSNDERASMITLLWIPGHHGAGGNEEVDACARQAAEFVDIAHHLASFIAASALICRTLMEPPSSHCMTKVYAKAFSWWAYCRAASTRRNAVLLVRLRAGYTPLPKAYANQIDTAVHHKCPVA